MKQGKLIVFEGADGSGKTTQAKLLLKYLQKRKIPSEYISFPRYNESFWAHMIIRYLKGEFGKLSEINPYFASLMYAGDRMRALPLMKKWLAAGQLVVCNRYVASNLAHMGARFDREDERQKYIRWLKKLEYQEIGLPQEDLVIFLDVPAKISQNLMKKRVKDIHEGNVDYLEKVVDVYRQLCRQKNWVKIDCTWRGKILTEQQIHEKILEVFRSRNILRAK